MSHWESFIKKDNTEWLLEKENPSVRYFTLVDILEKSKNDSEVIEAKEQIMKTGIVPKILSKQKSGGYWGIPQDFYVRSKYKGTVWNLIILAEIGADGASKKIKDACEFILNNSQNFESGGFAYTSLKSGGGVPSGVVPCLTGNMVWSLICFGYLDDPRIQKGIEWITKYQRYDDRAQDIPKDWPYKKHVNCFGKHTCHMGAVKSLKALAEIPKNKMSKEVKDTIKKGVEYLLVHQIYKRSHDLSKVSLPSWLQLGFPHMYQSDILEILDILNRLGIKDKRMQDAVDIIVSKQNGQGQWNLERTFNGRFLVNIEKKDKPSKWITLNALKTLKKYYT